MSSSTERILLGLAAVTVLLGLAAWINRQPSLTVTVLNPKFRLVSARISHGTTHKLYLDNWPKGQLMELLKATGLKAGGSPLSVQTTNRSYALVARFIGGLTANTFDPNQVWAEVVDVSGTTTRCALAQGYAKAASPHECGMIWLLASPPTNNVTVRLTTRFGQSPLAEIRLGGF